MCPWFSRNNSISGATSLKALRKEYLGMSIYSSMLFYYLRNHGSDTFSPYGCVYDLKGLLSIAIYAEIKYLQKSTICH